MSKTPIDLSAFEGHTPGPWGFRPFAQDDALAEQLRKNGFEPTQNCTNDGERYIMRGTTADDFYSRIALVATRKERKQRGKNATPYDAPDAERDAPQFLSQRANRIQG